MITVKSVLYLQRRVMISRSAKRPVSSLLGEEEDRFSARLALPEGSNHK